MLLLAPSLLPAGPAHAQTRVGLDFALAPTANWTSDAQVRLQEFQDNAQNAGEAAADKVAEEVAEATGAEPSTDATPCAVLSDELIQKHFEVSIADLTRTPSEYSPHPLYTVIWPKPNEAEIEKKREQAMIEYMQKKVSGEEVERPSLRTTDEVSLTINKDTFENRRATLLSAFDRAMRVLSEGMTVNTDAGTRETAPKKRSRTRPLRRRSAAEEVPGENAEDAAPDEGRAAWGDFPRLHGVYGKPARPSGRAGRRFFVSETCDGRL